MKRFLSILLAVLVVCAACAVGASAAAKKTFDRDAVTRCMLVNDTRGVLGSGHLGVVLEDEDGYGRIYSYRRAGLLKLTYTPAQLQQFLKDGIPFAGSLFQFDRVIAWGIKPEEGRRMYDHAENTEFKPFLKEASFWASVWPVDGDNCLTVARSIVVAGNSKYGFLYPFGQPNYPFYTMQTLLRTRGIPFTLYYPDSPKPEVPQEVLDGLKEIR
jgi:hypothetical protein